jgi:RNA polymerase-binding transcription factor DksA
MRSSEMNATGLRPSAQDGDLDATRELLEEQERKRVAEITELTIHLHDMRAALTQATGAGVGLVDVELLENRLTTARRALGEVQEALVRLADGSYGRCADCGGTIAPERLEVRPEARLCTACQATSRTVRR